MKAGPHGPSAGTGTAKEPQPSEPVEEGFEFLGYHYFRDPKTGRLVKEARAKSVRTFRDAVRRRTPPLKTQRRFKAMHCTLARLGNNQRVKEMVAELNLYLSGWHGYFKVV